MRIVFFTNTILEHGGGLEKYFIDVSSELARRYPDDDISVVTFNERRTELLQRALSLYYVKNMPISNIYREKTDDILRKLGRVRYVKCASFGEVRTELSRCDVIYSKNELIDLSILKWFGFKTLPPVIVGAHTPIRIPKALSFHDRLHNSLYLGFPYRMLLRGTTAVHAINSDDAELLKRNFGYRKVYMILAPFDSKKTVPEEPRSSDGGEFRLAFAGRLTAQKGIDILLECIHQLSLKSVFPSLRFRLAGSGEADFVKRFADLSETFPNVEYLGHVSSSDMDGLYRWSDIVLVPSYVETSNYVALEAGSSGRVVVASDLSGPREIVANGETGFLVRPVAEDFVKTIEAMYALKTDHPMEFLSIGTRAMRRIETLFSPDVIFPQLQAMFEETCRISHVK